MNKTREDGTKLPEQTEKTERTERPVPILGVMKDGEMLPQKIAQEVNFRWQYSELPAVEKARIDAALDEAWSRTLSPNRCGDYGSVIEWLTRIAGEFATCEDFRCDVVEEFLTDLPMLETAGQSEGGCAAFAAALFGPDVVPDLMDLNKGSAAQTAFMAARAMLAAPSDSAPVYLMMAAAVAAHRLTEKAKQEARETQEGGEDDD